jgi:predicted short-subunit dehydrogenase-like oxidoreductase (DUF2520 family)
VEVPFIAMKKMKPIRSVNIVGTGNVARALYLALNAKVNVRGVYSHSRKKRKAFEKAKLVYKISDLPANADLTIICVSDDAIASVARQLPAGTPVVHTSGAVPMDALSKFQNAGVLYPLQTFSAKRKIHFSEVPVFVEAGNKTFLNQLKLFSASFLSQDVHVLDSDERLRLHVAAVFANNFTTYLLSVAESMASRNELPVEILKPLIKETIAKYFELGYPDSQTGPARRGDKNTIRQHLKLITNKKDKEIYRLISEAIAQRFNA